MVDNIVKYILLIFYLIYLTKSELYSGDECDLGNGNFGVCKPIRECHWIQNQLKAKNITLRELEDLRCTFEMNEEVTCCYVAYMFRPALQRIGVRASQKACENYEQIKLEPISYNIISGKEVDYGEFPHMVAIGYPGNNNKIQFKCGGSLISDQYVLTAAHCANVRVPAPTIVRLGSINLGENFDKDEYGEPKDIKIESIKLYPKYVSNKQYHDVALIKLSQPVSFDDTIFPACIRSSETYPSINDTMLITGWGLTDVLRQKSSPIMLKASQSSYDFDQCKEKFGKTRKLPNGLNEGHLCAHDPIGHSDTCQGDSGGPLQIKIGKLYEIVGITSFGESCGNQVPGVYVRISNYIDWIESEVWHD